MVASFARKAGPPPLLNHSPVSKREVLVASPSPFPGSRRALPRSARLPGWHPLASRPSSRRRTLTQISRGLTKGGVLLPSTCALVLDGVPSGRLHEGFPTSPGPRGLACLQHGGVRVHETGQAGTGVAPLGGDPAVAHVPALSQRFLDHRTAVAALREPGPPGVELDHLPEGTREARGTGARRTFQGRCAQPSARTVSATPGRRSVPDGSCCEAESTRWASCPWLRLRVAASLR